MKCSHENCDKTYRNGFRLVKTKDGWRCVEHSGSHKSPDRPLSGREEAADFLKRQESLGKEFTEILHNNLSDLYIKSD